MVITCISVLYFSIHSITCNRSAMSDLGVVLFRVALALDEGLAHEAGEVLLEFLDSCQIVKSSEPHCDLHSFTDLQQVAVLSVLGNTGML
jgi:hypothetical protein